MNKYFYYILFFGTLCFSRIALSQNQTFDAKNIGDCFGAVSMDKNDQVKIAFTGKYGLQDDVSSYAKKLQLPTTNVLWLKLRTEMSGKVNITFEKQGFPVEYMVFRLPFEKSCASIQNGETNIELMGFSGHEKDKNNIEPLFIQSNEEIYVRFNTTDKAKKNLLIELNFTSQLSQDELDQLKSIQDLKREPTDPVFTVKIRDKKTKLPVESRVIISKSRFYNALYIASDFLFSDIEYLRMHLKVDAAGYFFEDVDLEASRIDTNELIVFMDPLEKNQLIELEGLEFESASDILLDSAQPKLRRLRDFMALNTDVKIAIQGHVHRFGKNTWKAKRLSKKRGKNVRDYLIQSGISSDRMTVKGYGNSRMKNPEAETKKEKQANRRVEIKIR